MCRLRGKSVVIPTQTIGFYNMKEKNSEVATKAVVIPTQTIGFYNYSVGFSNEAPEKLSYLPKR